MTAFITVVRRLSQLCGVVAALLLVVAVLVVCQLVVVRYALGQSAIWQHEFVSYSLVGATLIGSPFVLLTRGHVNVDLVPIYLHGRARLILALLAALAAFAFCLTIAVLGVLWWHEAWANNWHGETVWAPPLWIPRLALPIGMGLLSLQYLADILALITGREAPFGIAPEDGP